MDDLRELAVGLGFNIEESISFLGYKSYNYKNIELKKYHKIETIQQYINIAIDLIKTNIIKKMDKIKYNLKWKIRCFDEKIELHKLVEKILLMFFELKEELMLTLFPKDKQIIHRLEKLNIKKCIIIEIYDNELITGMLIMNFDRFI